VKPIYSESIYTWIGKINGLKADNNYEEIRFIEPMLKNFNYSFEIDQNNLLFKEAEALVIQNNKLLNENKEYWKQKSRNISDHIKDFE